jgi:hypothetical protein
VKTANDPGGFLQPFHTPEYGASGGDRCLSTVYVNTGDEPKEIMKDVARIQAEGRGFWFPFLEKENLWKEE